MDGFFDKLIQDYNETCSKLYGRIKELQKQIQELEAELPAPPSGKRSKQQRPVKLTPKNRAGHAEILEKLDGLYRRANVLRNIYQDMAAVRRVCENYYKKGVYLDQRYVLRGPRPYRGRQVPYYEIEDVLCHAIDFCHDRPLTAEIVRSIGDIDRKAKDGGDVTLWREVILPADGEDTRLLKAELQEPDAAGHRESSERSRDEADN